MSYKDPANDYRTDFLCQFSPQEHLNGLYCPAFSGASSKYCGDLILGGCMKFLLMLLVVATIVLSATEGWSKISLIGGYTTRNGTYVQPHYRDTSCDGNKYNNANYLGYND